jgi:hypothetical protein
MCIYFAEAVASLLFATSTKLRFDCLSLSLSALCVAAFIHARLVAIAFTPLRV